MREMTALEYKRCLLDVLDYIHKVCVSCGVEYSMYFGTLLGAVRHKGFIPWDDDIDIVMTPENYKRFKGCISKFENKAYSLVDSDNYDCYRLPFPKVIHTATKVYEGDADEKYVIGAYVDVFVADYLPENHVRRHVVGCIYKRLYRLWYRLLHFQTDNNRCCENGLGSWVVRLLSRVVSHHDLVELMKKLNERRATSLVSLRTCGARFEPNFSASDFKNLIKLEFEGRKYLAFRNYDEHLKKLYGDYMSLPPLESRVPKHDFQAFWK